MPYNRKELVIAGSIIYLVVVTALACFAASRALHLSLPIPSTLTGFTAALPIISGLLLQAGHSFINQNIKRNKSLLSKSPPPPYIFIVNTVILIYSSVVITLLGTHVAPASDLLCGLESRWKKMYSNKDNAIKEIQDALQCCGLMNSHDRAWPFPDKTHKATACEERFERTTGCIQRWRGEEQRVGGILMGVVGLVVIWELTILINPSFRRASWLNRVLPHRRQIGNGDEERNNTADPRRAIDFLPAGERYSDNPVVEASDSENEEPVEAPPQRSIQGQVADLFPSETTNGGEQHSGRVENEWARP